MPCALLAMPGGVLCYRLPVLQPLCSAAVSGGVLYNSPTPLCIAVPGGLLHEE